MNQLRLLQSVFNYDDEVERERKSSFKNEEHIEISANERTVGGNFSVNIVVGVLVKMGGCCCSSRKSHLVGTPVYYYCPESFEELGPSGTRAGVGSAFATGLLVDIGLETSIPDTFCAPAPLPYDLLLGTPQCTDSELMIGRISGSSFETLATCQDPGGSDCKPQASSVILSPRESNFSKEKGWKKLVDEDDDCCPICFEDYDVANPRLSTKCEHDFHLSCLLEWIERSDRCPICDKEVVFDDCLK